ncbi:hypothetical protein [Colwellia psychrerythraea]|nr:hypothetical protein [Colwellia psychrerythraea]
MFAKNKSSQRLGIAFQQQGVSLCSVPVQASDVTAGDNISAKVLFQHEKTSSANFSKTIQKLHDDFELSGDANIVLSEAQSQVVQVDKPNLPENEINSALKWKIKDLVTIPPDNMVLDYYDAPVLAGGKKKINVVCAPKDELRILVAATEQGSVKISKITTQEFAFANLLVAKNEANLLVCQQPNEEITLLIVKQKKIYFQRRLRGFAQIGSKTAEELSFSIIDDISLEIQRSTDYFERQLKQAPIKEIKVLLPIKLENVFIEKLAENSAVPVSLLEIPSPYHQHREFGAAIGASLEDIADTKEAEVLAGVPYDS